MEKDGFQSRFRGYITSFAEYEYVYGHIHYGIQRVERNKNMEKARGTIRLCLVKGLEVCFDTRDCHTISSLDSDCPFAAILPWKPTGILLNLRQRGWNQLGHLKSRITSYLSNGDHGVQKVSSFGNEDILLYTKRG